MNGGFLVTKIKQLGDRIFERILLKKGIDAFNGAQGRILYALWQEDGVPIKTVSEKCGLAITSLTTMLEWAGSIIKAFRKTRLCSLSHISNAFKKILKGGVKNERLYKGPDTEHESGHRLYCWLSILLRP